MKRIDDEQSNYFFWGFGRGDEGVQEMWDLLHAHFEKEARRDGNGTEETHEQGKGA